MSGGSINGEKHPYMRIEAWIYGVKGQPPLAEPWLKRTDVCLGRDKSPAEWMAKWLEKESRGNKKLQQR